MDNTHDGRLQLVLIDDHERARRALAERLTGHPELVVLGETSDLDEALQLVHTYQPHMALVDPVRRDGQGSRVVSAIAGLPALRRPVICAHLSYFDAAAWREMRDAGADDVVLKQTDLATIAAQLLVLAARGLPRERWPEILRD